MQLVCKRLIVYCSLCLVRSTFKRIALNTCTDVLRCKHCGSLIQLPHIAVQPDNIDSVFTADKLEIRLDEGNTSTKSGTVTL